MMPSEVKSGNHDIIAVQSYVTLHSNSEMFIIFTINSHLGNTKNSSTHHYIFYFPPFITLHHSFILFISLSLSLRNTVKWNSINHRSADVAHFFNDASIYSNDRFHYSSYLMDGTSMKEPAIIHKCCCSSSNLLPSI